MMTTCHAVVLHCDRTKASSLAHFDGCATSSGVREMVRLVDEISKHYEPSPSDNGKVVRKRFLVVLA